MTGAKRKRIIYAIFVLAALWGLYMQPWTRQERRRAAPPPTEHAAAATQPETGTRPIADLASFAGVSEWTIDPFRPAAPVDANDPVEPRAVPQAPVLQGTMMVRGDEVCVIGGQIYKTGDRAGSWKIVRINNGEVTLVGPNQERVTLNSHDAQRK